MKTMTIPRLELAGVVLAVTLEATVRKELDPSLQESVFWTDSTIVLGYIMNDEKRFNTFVAN